MALTARARLAAWIGLFSASFALGLVISSHFHLGVERRNPLRSTGSIHEVESGFQLLLVYVGRSDCRWCNDASLPKLLETARQRMSAVAADLGIGFATVGVAVDAPPEVGFDHLSEVGGFDQIAAGYGWGNDLALKYLWTDDATFPIATPTLFVFRRKITVPAETNSALSYREDELVRVSTFRGLESIRLWLARDDSELVSLPVSMAVDDSEPGI